jgi:hypothetical protein
MVELNLLPPKKDDYLVRAHYGQPGGMERVEPYQLERSAGRQIGAADLAEDVTTLRQDEAGDYHEHNPRKEQAEQAHFTTLPPVYNHLRRVAEPEVPGKFFRPEIAALITGGTRLLLTLGDELGKARGLRVSNRDTDSLYFERVGEMSREDFIARVEDVCRWFDDLSPFRRPGGSAIRLLKIEDENFVEAPKVEGDKAETERLEREFVAANGRKKIHEPLYMLAVSSKRYALGNKRWWNQETGQWVYEPFMRKVTTHGLGDKFAFEDYESPLLLKYAPREKDPRRASYCRSRNSAKHHDGHTMFGIWRFGRWWTKETLRWSIGRGCLRI